MDDPFERSRLSRTSQLSLAVLLIANLLLIGYFLSSSPESELPADQPPAAAPGLRLLTELSDNELAQLTDQPETLPEPVPEVPETRAPAGSGDEQMVCRVWGPITDTEVLAGLRVQLDEVGELLEVRVQEVAAAPDYLVYLKSGNNLDNARRIKQELDSQSIDAYVIAGGEYISSVSAGVFSSEQRARRQMATLADLGYAPELAALHRSQSVYQLMARVPGEFEVSGVQSVDCSEIASAR